MTSTLIVDIQNTLDNEHIPADQTISSWAQAAFNIGPANTGGDTCVTVRIVEKQESQALNKQYRQQDKPTNVLSFPMHMPADIEPSILGDIVVCADVVILEAQQQAKLPAHHWAHMIIHGMLHLLGYDHIEDEQAEQMEALEVKILTNLGIDNPYSS